MDYLRQRWADHQRMMLHAWDQGDHVSVICPTKSGKSTLVAPLLNARIERGGYVLAFLNKAEDSTLTAQFKGWKRYHKFPKRGIRRGDNKVVLWPKVRRTIDETKKVHAGEFKKALDWIAATGSVCAYVDETLYMTDLLRLEHELSFLHYFARSSGVSVVTSSQRPYRIPRIILSSASYTYIARTRDRDDHKRLGELGGTDVQRLVYNLERLPDRHDFLFSNPQGDLPSRILNTHK